MFLVKVMEVFGDVLMLMLTTFMTEGTRQLGSRVRGQKCILQLYNPIARTLTDSVEMPKDFMYAMTLYTGNFLSCSGCAQSAQ